MLDITPEQLEVLDRAQRDDFRRRAFGYAREHGAVAPDTPDDKLQPPFDYVEKLARDCALDAERSRLALFVLALTKGPGVFQDADLMAVLHDRGAPERIRIRVASDHVRARSRA